MPLGLGEHEHAPEAMVKFSAARIDIEDLG